jgi:hypothetical protein
MRRRFMAVLSVRALYPIHPALQDDKHMHGSNGRAATIPPA